MLEFANADKLDETMKFEMLNRKQLQDKYRDLREKMNKEK